MTLPLPHTDELGKFETLLRSTGVWCHHKGINDKDHFYVARNPKVNTAISLCFTVISPFDKLSQTTPARKCLVCSLYSEGGKEVKERIANHSLELPQFTDSTDTQTNKE